MCSITLEFGWHFGNIAAEPPAEFNFKMIKKFELPILWVQDIAGFYNKQCNVIFKQPPGVVWDVIMCEVLYVKDLRVTWIVRS